MDLVQHMISSMQRLGFTQSATIDHRRLAVDLAEVIIEWEKRRFKEEQGVETPINVVGGVKKNDPGGIGIKRSGSDFTDAVSSTAKRARAGNQVSFRWFSLCTQTRELLTLRIPPT